MSLGVGGDAVRPIMVSLVKNVFLTLQRAGGEQRVCVGVFVWGVLELCVAEARTEAVSAFMRRLIVKEKPLFFHVSAKLLSAPLR